MIWYIAVIMSKDNIPNALLKSPDSLSSLAAEKALIELTGELADIIAEHNCLFDVLKILEKIDTDISKEITLRLIFLNDELCGKNFKFAQGVNKGQEIEIAATEAYIDFTNNNVLCLKDVETHIIDMLEQLTIGSKQTDAGNGFRLCSLLLVEDDVLWRQLYGDDDLSERKSIVHPADLKVPPNFHALVQFAVETDWLDNPKKYKSIVHQAWRFSPLLIKINICRRVFPEYKYSLTELISIAIRTVKLMFYKEANQDFYPAILSFLASQSDINTIPIIHSLLLSFPHHWCIESLNSFKNLLDLLFFPTHFSILQRALDNMKPSMRLRLKDYVYRHSSRYVEIHPSSSASNLFILYWYLLTQGFSNIDQLDKPSNNGYGFNADHSIYSAHSRPHGLQILHDAICLSVSHRKHEPNIPEFFKCLMYFSNTGAIRGKNDERYYYLSNYFFTNCQLIYNDLPRLGPKNPEHTRSVVFEMILQFIMDKSTHYINCHIHFFNESQALKNVLDQLLNCCLSNKPFGDVMLQIFRSKPDYRKKLLFVIMHCDELLSAKAVQLVEKLQAMDDEYKALKIQGSNSKLLAMLLLAKMMAPGYSGRDLLINFFTDKNRKEISPIPETLDLIAYFCDRHDGNIESSDLRNLFEILKIAIKQHFGKKKNVIMKLTFRHYLENKIISKEALSYQVSLKSGKALLRKIIRNVRKKNKPCRLQPNLLIKLIISNTKPIKAGNLQGNIIAETRRNVDDENRVLAAYLNHYYFIAHITNSLLQSDIENLIVQYKELCSYSKWNIFCPYNSKMYDSLNLGFKSSSKKIDGYAMNMLNVIKYCILLEYSITSKKEPLELYDQVKRITSHQNNYFFFHEDLSANRMLKRIRNNINRPDTIEKIRNEIKEKIINFLNKSLAALHDPNNPDETSTAKELLNAEDANKSLIHVLHGMLATKSPYSQLWQTPPLDDDKGKGEEDMLFQSPGTGS